MGQFSNIEWCVHTCNLWWGCFEVHEGCDHCFARVFAKSKGKGTAWKGDRFAVSSIWNNLRKWQDAAAKAGEIHRVFTGSMMDIFEKPRPAFDWQGNSLGATTGELRDRYFLEVIPATPNLMHLLLTKRPSNVLDMVPSGWLKDWPANVMTGASVVNQETANTLVPQLLRAPGPWFLSVEPLLGGIDLSQWLNPECSHCEAHAWTDNLCGSWHCASCESARPRLIDWVIVGGESGPGARPMSPRWARDLRDQCVAARVPLHFKQWGEWAPSEDHPLVKESLPWAPSDCHGVVRVGKKAAGRVLDGRTWDEFPQLAEHAGVSR